MKYTLILTSLVLAPLATIEAAETLLIENGQPRAEIVITEKPPRTVQFAAEDLRTYIEKISGARIRGTRSVI